jgi:hypothetical protein
MDDDDALDSFVERDVHGLSSVRVIGIVIFIGRRKLQTPKQSPLKGRYIRTPSLEQRLLRCHHNNFEPHKRRLDDDAEQKMKQIPSNNNTVLAIISHLHHSQHFPHQDTRVCQAFIAAKYTRTHTRWGGSEQRFLLIPSEVFIPRTSNRVEIKNHSWSTTEGT